MMRRAACLLALCVVAAACRAPEVAQPAPSATAQLAPSAPASPATSASPTLAPVAPRDAACGEVLTASITLASDLTCSKDALVVGANGITIDLGGRTLKGPGMGPQTWPNPQLDSVGIRVEGRRDVTIKNGRTTDFSTGIYFKGVAGSVIEAVSSERSRYGFYIHESNGNQIKASKVELNIYGLHLQSSHDNLVQGNQLVRQTYNSPGGYGLYLYASQRNRITENTIEGNVNWGIWFSEATANLTFHNNVTGNRPQVSDNKEGNIWHDPTTKQGNFWGDYPGRDTNGDGIGDSSYLVLGPPNVVDPYPFIERDGWKKKRTATIDTYAPPVARAPRSVTLVALAGGTVYAARPAATEAEAIIRGARSIALSMDERKVYALGQPALSVYDLAARREIERRYPTVANGIVAANRDSRSILIVGPEGAEQLRSDQVEREYYAYSGAPHALAPSYKHNHIFVASPKGITLLYLNFGGRTPYTIPLDGPAGAIAMNLSGTRIYVVALGTGTIDVVETEQYAVVDRIPLGLDATALAISKDESTLYAGTPNGLLAIDVAKKAVRERATFLGSVADLAVSPNGDEVYAALAGLEHAIAVVRASDLRVTNMIELAAAPTTILAASY